jgi:hypothetical protein
MIFVKPYLLIGKSCLYFHQTPQERENADAARAEAKLRRAVRNEQQKEIKYFSRAIPVWLANMGYAYWYRKSEKDMLTRKFNPVRIDRALIGDDAYYLKINMKRLPRGVFSDDLSDPKTLRSLTAAAQSKVTFENDEKGGCWYVIETAYGRGKIPALVGYAEMLKLLPADAPPLAMPLGMAENKRPLWGDFNKMYTLLIGGTKDGGKSNIANVIICTFLSRNSAKSLRIFLTDLKGGLEFADYRGVPHLGGDVWAIKSKRKEITDDTKKHAPPPSIRTVELTYKPGPDEDLLPPLGQQVITEPGDVLPMLAYVEAELDRRARLMAGRAKKLATWNNRYPDKAMSVWVVAIDELATLMEDPRYKAQAKLSLSEIARKGRAVGIYLILATQNPTSDIVPGQISNNMDSRLAFRCGTGTASGTILGTMEYDAVRLPVLPGRFIWKWGGDKTEAQAPLIADGTIRSIVADAKAGKIVDAKQAELAQKADFLFKFALETLGGECQTNRLFAFIKDQGFKKSDVVKILDLYEWRDDKPEIPIADDVYFLAPSIPNKRVPRWLVPVSAFKARRHTHKDYNFDLVCRVPFAEKSPLPVYPENQDLKIIVAPPEAKGDIADFTNTDIPDIPDIELPPKGRDPAEVIPAWLEAVNQQ